MPAIRPDAPLFIISSLKISQVFGQILNAIDAMPEGGKLGIEAGMAAN
jgi:hypothetical protein